MPTASEQTESLQTAYPGARNAEEAIRHAARDRLDQARDLGMSGPPFDPKVLASLLDIKTRCGHLGKGLEAMIVPNPKGEFTIVWDPKHPRKRTNFSIAHEIGHTLFPDCASQPQFRRDADEALLESLCDTAAAELLMPYDDFRKDVLEFGTSLDSVSRLSTRYQSSHEAVAIRVQYVTDMPLAVLVANLLGPSLQIQYAVANRGYRNIQPFRQLHPGCLIPRYSVAQKAVRSPMRISYSREREVWYIGGRRHDFSIGAMCIPSRHREPPRVLALLKPCL